MFSKAPHVRFGVRAFVCLGIVVGMLQTFMLLSRFEYGRMTEPPSSYHLGVDLYLSFTKEQLPASQQHDASSSSSLKNNHTNQTHQEVDGGQLLNNNNRTSTQTTPVSNDAVSSLLASSSSSTSSQITRLDKLLLNTPFYVYEELYWLNEATVGNMSAAAWIQTESEIKHTDDWWFAKAAMRHPMRTQDPTKAKLFIVPALLNMAVDQIINYSNEWDNYKPEPQFRFYNTSLCYNDLCNLQLIEYVNQFLSESTWFQRNQGQDHVIVASHWASEWVIPRYNNLASCNVIGWETGKWNRLEREMMPSLYVGNPCPPQLGNKTDDFAMICSLKNRAPFKVRRKICRWMRTINITSCGPGPQCPALAKARFGFHVRGDTWGSNRLIDTLLSGTLPVFTSKEQYDMLPDWIDWSKISNYAHVAVQTRFMKHVKNMAKDMKEWEEKMRHVLLNRELFDWTTLVPFDVYLYQLSVQLWPQDEWERREKHPISTPFTALKLPKMTTTSLSSTPPNKTNNNITAAAADVALKSFQTFTKNKQNGSTNCGGINGYVNSCDQCNQKESTCFGGCMWCEHGSIKVGDSDYLWSLDNRQQRQQHQQQQSQGTQPHNQQCVHRSQQCR